MMMDLALLAIGMLVIGSTTACAYGLFFVRDGLDDLKQQIAALNEHVRQPPVVPEPVQRVAGPPRDLLRLGRKLARERVALRQAMKP